MWAVLRYVHGVEQWCLCVCKIVPFISRLSKTLSFFSKMFTYFGMIHPVCSLCSIVILNRFRQSIKPKNCIIEQNGCPWDFSFLFSMRKFNVYVMSCDVNATYLYVSSFSLRQVFEAGVCQENMQLRGQKKRLQIRICTISPETWRCILRSFSSAQCKEGDSSLFHTETRLKLPTPPNRFLAVSSV